MANLVTLHQRGAQRFRCNQSTRRFRRSTICRVRSQGTQWSTCSKRNIATCHKFINDLQLLRLLDQAYSPIIIAETSAHAGEPGALDGRHAATTAR